MSVSAMSWVFGLKGDEAPKLGTRLVLLALADNAGPRGDDERMVAWPSVATLARKACISERATQYALRSLREAGLIAEVGKSPAGTVIYALSMGVQNLHRGGEAGFTGGAKLASPEPSLEPSLEEDSLRSSSTSSVEKREKLRAANGVVTLCDRLAELMKANDPEAKVRPESIGWMDAAEKLMRIDNRHFEEAMAVLEFSQRDPFWSGQVHSMPYFRIKYPALRAKWINTLQRNGSAPQKPQPTVAELMAAQEKFHADQRERLARRGITPDSSSRRETNARPAQGAKS